MSGPTNSSDVELASPFVFDCGDEKDLGCIEVRGFDEAAAAAFEIAMAPSRLVLDGPDERLRAFLEAWAEDVECVRRTLIIRMPPDGPELVVVATIATHGYGVATSLAVESLAPNAFDFTRSGVHPKADRLFDLARLD